MARDVIIVHGGSLSNNIYEGGAKDYIPMPLGGISFLEFLSKLEV